MTRTAKEILENLLDGTDAKMTEIGWERFGENVDQALKEVEAIIKAAKPKKQDENPYEDGVHVETYGYEETHNRAIDEYEANLLTALYGEEK